MIQAMAKAKKHRYSTIDQKVDWMVRNQWIWWHRLLWCKRLVEVSAEERWQSDEIICTAMREAGLISSTTKATDVPSDGIDVLVRRALNVINN